MSDCCGSEKNFTGVSTAYKRILLWIIAINAAMFVVEMTAGIGAQSQALQADALDFLADSATYAASLWVIGKALSVRSAVSLLKGASLLLMAAWVFGATAYRLFYQGAPDAYTMGAIAIAAFIANVLCVLLLLKYKDGDSSV